MKRKFKKLLSLLLVFLLCLTGMPFNALGEETETKKPDNIVLSYKEAEKDWAKSFSDEAAEEVPLKGYIPASYSASSFIPSSISVEKKDNVVTPIKNQNPYGTCWAHAAISTAETSAIKSGFATTSTNYNEYHLVNYAYSKSYDALNLFGGDWSGKADPYTNVLNFGGNQYIALCTFANWMGVSGASESTYGAANVLNGDNFGVAFAYDDAAHLENGYILYMPDMESGNYQTDMYIVKQAIMDYGSVAISYHAPLDGYYDNLNGYQYMDYNPGTNHAVTVIGWNDNIPADAFNVTAPGNGAWLVKNSWGDGYGLGGYFWLSYYDCSIGSAAFAMDVAEENNYDNNYQYDGTANFDGTGYYSNQVYGANVFVADSNEVIEAVGTYTLGLNVELEVRIYTDLQAGASPTSGVLATTQTVHKTYMGYHTIDLNQSVEVDAGERYAVVIAYKQDSDGISWIPLDRSFSGYYYEYGSYAKAGESYYGFNLNNLNDCNPNNVGYYADGINLRIKAFTNEKSGSQTGVNVSYRTHVENYGWQNYVQNGQVSGTSGQALRLEGINISVSGNANLGIGYSTHVQDIGWMADSYDGQMSGTEGRALRLEAIKIFLHGADAAKYDVYYRVHAENIGWMGWAKDNEPAGTAGYAYRLEAIQIIIVDEGATFDPNVAGITSNVPYAYTSKSVESVPNVNYQTHVENIGWQEYVSNGAMSGTEGRALRLEGIRINLSNSPYSGGIKYTTHVQEVGWMDWAKNGQMAGTEGRALRLEGIEIKLVKK